MENQTNIQITILKPCHEDWNKMTPNEKGSFCGKCAKTVIDFTKRTNEEIRDFLTEQSGKKICGRFMNDQIDQPVKPIDFQIPLHLIPSRLSFSKLFAVALLISFGTTLFSCRTTQGEVVGKISAGIDTINVSETNETAHLMDDTILENNDPKNVPVKCSEIKGDVAIEVVKGEVLIPVDTIKKDSLQKEIFKLGKIKQNN